MPHNVLDRLIVDRVALCNRGANQGAHIMLLKAEADALYDAALRVHKKDYSTSQRVEYAKKGWAIPVKDSDGNIVGGRFPIADAGDLEDAVSSYGRGGSATAEVKAFITKRAKALGKTDVLPADWPGSTKKAGGPQVSKVGRKISAARLAQIKGAHEVLAGLIEEASAPAAAEAESKSGEREEVVNMPDELTQEQREALDPAVKAYVEGLEAKAKAEAEAPAPTDANETDPIAKAVASITDPTARELIAKSMRDAAEAQATAKAERELREDGEWTAKVARFDRVSALDAGKLGPMLRKAKAEGQEDLVEEVERLLKAQHEAAKTSHVFGQIGRSGGDGGGSALESLKAAADELRKVDADLTPEAAFAKAARANPDLAAAYREETGIQSITTR